MEKQSSTKAILENYLIELMKTNSIDKITVTDIINHSGFSRPTFYRYFNGVDDLVYSVHSNNLSLAFDVMLKVKSFKVQIKLYLELMLENHKFYRQIITLDFYNPFTKLYLIKTKENFDKFFFADSIDIIKSDEDLSLMFDLYIFGITNMILDWIKRPKPYSIDTFTRVALDSIPPRLKELLPKDSFS